MRSEREHLTALQVLCERHPTCYLELSWPTCLTVLGALQTVLRHPQLPPAARQTLRGLVDHVIDMTETVSPGVAAVMRLGDDPAHDVR